MDYHKILKHPKTNVPYIDTNDAIKDYRNSVVAKSEDNDCVVRALAAVTDSTYEESHAYIKKTFKRINGNGTPNFDTIMKKNIGKRVLGRKYVRLTNHTTTTYVKTVRDRYWGTVHKIKTTLDSRLYPLITTYGKTRASQMTVKTFLSDYNVGSYLIHVRSHCFTIIDGVVIGNVCDSSRLKARICNAYKFN
jgi:hypothetical protein